MKQVQIAHQLWDKLWEDYSARVNYARIYQQAIAEAGGTMANDHIAFRSLRVSVNTSQGKINLGIEYIARIVEALGYSVAGELYFPEQKLYARHYRHPEQERFDLPKLFISELIVDELPDQIAQLIWETVTARLVVETPPLEAIASAKTDAEVEPIAEQLKSVFARPWNPPRRYLLETVNVATQYGAWVLLHGYAVNHFTGYINRQNAPQYPDIESTAKALGDRGVPMKAEIEGSPECGLRQTATQAVKETVNVLDDSSGEAIQIPWTYAYFEIAERHPVEIAPGQRALFDGFLGANATNLFEMTRRASQ